MAKKRHQRQWKERSAAQRVRVIVTVIGQFALLIAAIRDLRSRSPEEINGSKRLWYGLVFINYIGPIAYFIFGRKRS